MTMTNISIVGAASYLPQTIVDNDYFKEASGVKRHPMFKGIKFRRHLQDDESAVDMAARAIGSLAEKLNINPQRDIDILLTNCTLADQPFVGIGASLVGALGLKPKHVFDLHSGGCVSFIYMMELARALMRSGSAKSAVICNLQTAAGRVFSQKDNLKFPQSSVPGDGCGVAYLVASDINPVVSIVTRTHGEFAGDMEVSTTDTEHWWKPGLKAFNIDFNEGKIGAIVSRANRIVPEAFYAALDEAQLSHTDVDALITNQPNRILLRNWRESIMLAEEKHINTLEYYGNLFGAALPINLAKGIDEGSLKNGDTLLMGGFSHAGDYSAAAVIQCNNLSGTIKPDE